MATIVMSAASPGHGLCAVGLKAAWTSASEISLRSRLADCSQDTEPHGVVYCIATRLAVQFCVLQQSRHFRAGKLVVIVQKCLIIILVMLNLFNNTIITTREGH